MSQYLKYYSRHLVHPVTLISSSDGERENVATMAWVSAVSTEPPLLMVAVNPKRFSHDLVLASREFAILVLSNLQKELATLAGTISGRKTNKWELDPFSRLKRKAEKIKAPVMNECRAILECKLVNHITAGDHTLFIGEIVSSEIDQNVQPLILFNHRYFNPGQFIANYP
jgi:flavin reductase (DIM6/NTAB) family NADH-FMN oxidoreductase RutF